MSLRSSVVAVIVLLLASFGMTQASTLEDKKNEWAFSLTATDMEGFGSTAQFTLDWSYIVANGYFQLGVSATGYRVDPDDPFEPESESSSAGPLFEWNWTPKKERATGYLLVSAQGTGGDVADFYDGVGTLGVGVKAFVGNSAAINVLYAFDRLVGASGFDDQDQTRLTVGISLYAIGR